MKQTNKDFYQHVYSVPMNELVEVWVQTFYPIGTLLIIWDAKNHFELLQECGILVKSTEAYDNKIVTVELPGVLEAYELLDNIQEQGYCPFMQVYAA